MDHYLNTPAICIYIRKLYWTVLVLVLYETLIRAVDIESSSILSVGFKVSCDTVMTTT